MFSLRNPRTRFGRLRPSGPGLTTSTIPRINPRAIPKSDHIFDRLDSYWYGGKSGFIPRETPGASEESLQGFEQTHTVKLPADLRAYLLRFNGVEEDPDLFCFWPLSRLASVPLVLGATKAAANLREVDRYFVFADYMIGSWYYAIYLGEDPDLQNSVVIPDFQNRPILASSFSDFLELYVSDGPRLYGDF